jgi:hypothetical protein
MIQSPEVQPFTIGRQTDQIELCLLNFLDRHHRICRETITYCLFKGGEYTTEKLIRLLQDCAEICQTAANFMIRNSDILPAICNACAEVCLKCAEACEGLREDYLMEACAEACRQCAEFCQVRVVKAAKICNA